MTMAEKVEKVPDSVPGLFIVHLCHMYVILMGNRERITESGEKKGAAGEIENKKSDSEAVSGNLSDRISCTASDVQCIFFQNHGNAGKR